MSKNRTRALDVLCKMIDEIYPAGNMSKIYRSTLGKLSDDQFDAYIERLRNGISLNPDLDKPRELVTLIVPNLTKNRISVDHLTDVADKWGVKLFERIWITDPVTGDTYLTNRKHLILTLPVARQAQTLEKKISVAKDNKHIDSRTNQPAASSDSKASALSYPETQLLLSLGLDKTVTELLKFRGGDQFGFRIMNKHLVETGVFDQTTFDNIDTRPKAVDTFSSYLFAMHLNNTLIDAK